MKIEQLYTGCLAHGAYYITSNGEAALIDPLREPAPYLQLLARDGVTLKYIFETHFHADFVSGHVDLSNATGAKVVYGPDAQCAFNCISAADNQLFQIGDIQIKVLHTPGHTMESSTFLLIDTTGKDHCIFSGDTLFIGDVGRPDLAQKAANMTQYQLAGLLYDSIMNKIMPLSDDVIVYPGHGKGSACGKKMMSETQDTLGHQKSINYALKQPNRAAFIKSVTDGLLPPPAYFGFNVAMNKQGYNSFESVLHQGMQALSIPQFEAAAENDKVVILDTRPHAVFCKGFIPKSINIGLEGDFAPWVGCILVDVSTPLLLICTPGTEEQTITRLSRVGFDNILGFLKGGFDSWQATHYEIDLVERISAQHFAREIEHNENIVIDVRRANEYEQGHVEHAINKPLDYINEWIMQINPKEHFYLYCGGGYRSMIAASILQASDYRNFTEVEGGINAISKTAVTIDNSLASQSQAF